MDPLPETTDSQIESVESWSISRGVNMTNCNKQCELFFERYESINLKVLIGFWMMAGYLGPAQSADRIYRKGHAILMELVNELRILQFSDESKEMIELSADSCSSCCRHQGFCVTEDLEFVGSLDLDKIGLVELKDGKPKTTAAKRGSGSFDVANGIGNYKSNTKQLKYTAYCNPRTGSLKPLLHSIHEPSTLLLQGCDLMLEADFPYEKFSTLTVLEISGLSRVPFSLQEIIFHLYQLQTLNLSYLPIETLAIDFSQCGILRRLILKGFSYLESVSIDSISNLTSLQSLNLWGLLMKQLPHNFFAKLLQLRFVIFRCSKLVCLPSVEALMHLKMLDVSHCSALKIIPSIIESPDFQMIVCSYTSMVAMPTIRQSPSFTHLIARNTGVVGFGFLRQVDSLEVVDLSGAMRVTDFKQLVGNKKLSVLDLSRTRITSTCFLSDSIQLRKLIIRECYLLHDLSSVEKLRRLEVLDLQGCKSLKELPEGLSDLSRLEELDISFTSVSRLPSFSKPAKLLKLSLKGLKLASLEGLASLYTLEQLDLNSIQIVPDLDFVQLLVNLRVLDLSQTVVAQLPDLSKLVNLKELLLGNCRKLQLLPDLQNLTNLETLDLSLHLDYTTAGIREDEYETVQFLSAPTNLKKLVLSNRSGVLELFPLTSLASLEYLDICGTSDIDFVREHSSKMENLQEGVGWSIDTRGGHVQGRSSKANEFHLVSFYLSGFYRFKTNFKMLQELISEIQMETLAIVSNKSKAFRRHFGSIHNDLQYLLENIHLLENSHDPKSCEELLHELIDAATDPSYYDSLLDSTNLDVLLRLVLKLKLLLPTKQLGDLYDSETTREKKLQFTRRKKKEREVTDDIKESRTMEDLLDSYRSLNGIERKCLLCFSVFPLSESRHDTPGVFRRNNLLVIKKRMLIQWWAGEEFIDPQHKKYCSSSRDEPEEDSEQVSIIEESKTTMEIGKEILETLEAKYFIETVMDRDRDSGSCCMSPFVYSFVSEEAKKERFSGSGQENGELSQCQRICLLKSQDYFLSSCNLQGKYPSIRALLNVDETIVDIGSEWFSKMNNLLVLHLGSWGSHDEDHIEVVKEKFLEELRSMEQLRLLSLQGFSAITKLPDSICKLTNLRILNLRGCSYLEELPAGIGSLKNLIHLDVTQCSFLPMLPKGMWLLSKLEVLKGLSITYQADGKQHDKAFILRDLLKLRSLNKLSLIVNKEDFPSSEDLQVFKEMKRLSNLKITWEKSYIVFDESNASTANEVSSRHSRWQRLKCWGSQSQEAKNDKERTLNINYLDNLKKLVFCCFPSESAPGWLDPLELRNLEKLYIVGGNLGTFRVLSEARWSVNILRFKYLRNLKISWPILRNMFPNITYLENHQCDNLTRFPCDNFGVWRIQMEYEETPEERVSKLTIEGTVTDSNGLPLNKFDRRGNVW